MRSLLLALAISGFAASSSASGLSMMGNVDCGVWLKQPDSKRVYLFWVGGYLSAMNATLSGEKGGYDFLKGVSPQQVEAYVDRYCSEHPLRTLQDGAISLINELPRKR